MSGCHFQLNINYCLLCHLVVHSSTQLVSASKACWKGIDYCRHWGALPCFDFGCRHGFSANCDIDKCIILLLPSIDWGFEYKSLCELEEMICKAVSLNNSRTQDHVIMKCLGTSEFWLNSQTINLSNVSRNCENSKFLFLLSIVCLSITSNVSHKSDMTTLLFYVTLCLNMDLKPADCMEEVNLNYALF